MLQFKCGFDNITSLTSPNMQMWDSQSGANFTVSSSYARFTDSNPNTKGCKIGPSAVLIKNLSGNLTGKIIAGVAVMFGDLSNNSSRFIECGMASRSSAACR
jgi:hypothetical protein